MKNTEIKLGNYTVELGEMLYIVNPKVLGNKNQILIGQLYSINDLVNTFGTRQDKNIQVYVNNINTLYNCNIEDLEPIAQDVYKVGDKVTSTLSMGGFIGIVTGFELATNRVICKSVKTQSDRTRYAYKLNEIRPYQVVEFKLGNIYKINNKYEVIIMGAQNTQSEYCNIYYAKTFRLMFSNVQLRNTPEYLKEKLNINELELLQEV